MRRTLSRLASPCSLRATRCLTILVLIALELGWVGLGAAAVGTPLYPDLITTAPSGLYIEKGPDGKYLLRFANTAVNLGGRMEIAVGSGTRDLYQNVYDQYVGGNRVIHQKVGADLIYHPQHNHFHFEGFAKYELLKKDSSGYYRATSRTGSKTTYCILDTLASRHGWSDQAPVRRLRSNQSRASRPAGATPTSHRSSASGSISARRHWRMARTRSGRRPIPTTS